MLESLLNVFHAVNELEVVQGVGIPQSNGTPCRSREIELLLIHCFVHWKKANMNMEKGR